MYNKITISKLKKFMLLRNFFCLLIFDSFNAHLICFMQIFVFYFNEYIMKFSVEVHFFIYFSLGTEEIFGEMCDIRCSFLQSGKISFTRGSVASVSLKFQNEGFLIFNSCIVLFVICYYFSNFKLFNFIGKIAVLFHAPELSQDVYKGVIFQEQIPDNKDKTKLNFLQFILQIPEKVDYKCNSIILFIHYKTTLLSILTF